MPERKSSKISKKETVPTPEEEGLVDFEKFISQTPVHRPQRSEKTWFIYFIVVVIVALAGALIFIFKTSPLQKNSQYKAVVLENGFVYYAKVVKEDARNIYLDDVYYIEMQDQVVAPQDTNSNEQPQTVSVPVLIKRGQELHQPQGWMQINWDKVVAVEEVGPDSEIIKEIQRLKTAGQ